jgi:lipopolysaccharide/colanic/teichoic acid biosynthesis glycosyltransferase
MKRLLDILLSGLGILVFLPFGIPIALILLLTGEHEIFYRQQRIGRNGKPFGLMKFATMRKNSSSMGAGNITLKNDPRVLPFGKFLRKTKLNEVPQLWNIFNGDMSVVGPRPLPKSNYEMIPEQYRNRTMVLKPGLTGAASIVFRDEEEFLAQHEDDPMGFYAAEIAPYKGRAECWYLENRSFWMDIKIIFLTAWVVIFPKSRLPKKIMKGLPPHPLFNP